MQRDEDRGGPGLRKTLWLKWDLNLRKERTGQSSMVDVVEGELEGLLGGRFLRFHRPCWAQVLSRGF